MKSFVDFNKEVLVEGRKYDNKILRLFTGGKSPEVIASQLNVDVDTVNDYINNRMPKSQDNSPRGYSSGRNSGRGVTEGATMTDTIDEKLVGKQKKLDVNKNGKLDAEDFKKLRKEEAELEEADRGFRGVGGARDREDDEHHHLDNHNSTEKPKPYKVPKKSSVDFTQILKDMRDKKTKLGEAKCKEDAPFEGGVPSKGNVKDKSGAVHTPMSRARHAAKEALKQYSKTKNEEVDLDEWKIESDWKKSDPEDKRSGQEKAKALAAKAATPTKLKPKKTFEEDDKLLARTGMNLPHKFPRSGQTNLGNIPAMNTPGNSKETDAYAEKRRGDRAKQLKPAIKAALGTHGPKSKLPEEVELDEEINIFCEEMISHSDFHDKIAMHKKAGNNVVDYDHSEKKAHITTIDKEGMKRKVVYTPKGVSMQNMGQHQGDDKDETGEKIKKADTTGEKRGRGRPAGSKSGANLANAPAKRDFRGIGTHSLNISSNRSMREEVELEEAEMSPEMKAKQERIVKGMKKSYSSFVSKYGDKAKNVMYATATKMAMKEETELEEAVATGNPGFGYHGEHEPEVADKKYSKAHATVKKIAGEAGHLKDAKKPNELVKSYLDSKRGRHLAGNETDHEYIKRDFGQFKKNSQ